MYGHMDDVPTATTKKEEEEAATHSFPDNPPPSSDASGPHPPIPDVMVNPQSYMKLIREVSGSSLLGTSPETKNGELLETKSPTLTLDQLTNHRNATAMPVPPKLLGVYLNTKTQSDTREAIR